jgi:Leucine-rich repeat (LRR) protein
MQLNQTPVLADNRPSEVQSLIENLQTGEEANVLLALQLAEGLNNRLDFDQYLQDLLPLYNLVFSCKRKEPLDAQGLIKLFEIERLFIYDQNLITLPDNMGELKRLTLIQCANNELLTLPDSIGNLENLDDFVCHSNRLGVLPPSFVRLKNVKRIDVSHNQLETLPSTIWQMQKLERFDCGHNQLTALPEELALLPNLQYLNARGNPISYIPPQLRQRQREGLELLIN